MNQAFIRKIILSFHINRVKFWYYLAPAHPVISSYLTRENCITPISAYLLEFHIYILYGEFYILYSILLYTTFIVYYIYYSILVIKCSYLAQIELLDLIPNYASKQLQ